MGVRVARPEVKAEFAAWMATPKRLKISLGLPQTQKDFAELKGVSDRQLRRWKSDPEFEQWVDQEKVRIQGELPNSTVRAMAQPRAATDARAVQNLQPPAAVTEQDDPLAQVEVSAEERQYLQVKQTLVKMAEDGSTQAADLFMKHWGKAFIEAEQTDGLSQLAEMSDEELLAQVLDLIGEEALADWLAGRAAA